MNDGLKQAGKTAFLRFRTHEIKIALSRQRTLQIHHGLKFQDILGTVLFSPESIEIGNDKGIRKSMTEKKGRAVEKRNQYDIGNEAGISYMNKGLQGLLAQMKHLFPFGKKGIPALDQSPAIPVEIQPGMNNPF
nr:hypothetical protein [Mailhella massiliensis]